MSSPIFDSTFGTGRFRREEPMTTDQSQSDTEPKQDVRGALEAVELVVSYALIAMDCNRKNDVLPMSGQDVERARIGLKTIRAALAQSDAGPVVDRIAELEREIYTLRANLVECADTLSAQQFNQAQQKRIEACRVELAALKQSDAESAADEKADALRSEYKTYARQIDRRWAGVHGELIPDCPTEGVAARQGNGG